MLGSESLRVDKPGQRLLRSVAMLVDPIDHTLEGLRLEGGRWSILGVFHDDRAEPFDAIELELGIPWADVKLD